MPLIVPRELLQQANGLRATALSTGEIAGPVLAGVLIAGVGPGWALAVDAATFALSATFLAGLRLPAVRARRRRPSSRTCARAGASSRSMTWVWAFVAGAAWGTRLGAWSVLGPVVAERTLGGPRRGARSSARSGSARCSAACWRSAHARADRW